MKKINVDTIFKVFDQDDRSIYLEEGLESLLEDDDILLNLVVRGLENYWLLDEIYTNKEPVRYEKIKYKVKDKFYNKMYGFLKKVNLNNLECFYSTVQDLGYGSIQISLQDLLNHFIDLEEYEKCSYINKVLKLIESLYYPEKATFQKNS